MSILFTDMQYSTIYNPIPRNSFLHKNYKSKKNTGSIFRLPRSILSTQILSPRNQSESLSKQKVKQEMRNTKFNKQYRENLRKTIFSQTKGMLKPNKFDRLENQRLLSMRQLQKSSSKKISPYDPRKNQLPSGTSILYKTIVNQQHSPRRKMQPLQLAVQKLPIIQLKKRTKKPFAVFAEQNQHPQYTYQSAITNGNVSIRQRKVVSHFDKNFIQPWDTIQQFNLNAEQP